MTAFNVDASALPSSMFAGSCSWEWQRNSTGWLEITRPVVFPEGGQRKGQDGKYGGLMMVIELRGNSNCVAAIFLRELHWTWRNAVCDRL